VAKSNIFSRIIGRSAKERKRRRAQLAKFASWTFVAAVTVLVVLLAGQFVSRMFITPPVSAEVERTDLLVTAGEKIQLKVLNASGEPNLAREFTDFLRARKFDVVEMGNYGEVIEQTLVVDKVNDKVAAGKVAYALGVSGSRVISTPDTEAFVDAEVIIGKDFLSLKPKQ
jgi:hypothetical protein